VAADIPITIRRGIVHIPIEPAIVRVIIPIPAQFSNLEIILEFLNNDMGYFV
jgi:hypothetical protein